MIVVDANVFLPLLREDALTAMAQSVRATDPEWIMPSLLKIEVVNALLNEVKAGYLTFDDAMRAVVMAADLTAETHIQDPVLREILPAARQSGLTAYDATYVVLARSLGLPLLTEDRGILRACADVARSMRQFLAPPEQPPMTVRQRRVGYKTARRIRGKRQDRD